MPGTGARRVGREMNIFFPVLSSSRLWHQGPTWDLIAHFISPQAWDWGMGDFVKTNGEIKLHPESSGPRFIASSQTGQSSTWNLFQNEQTLILPRLKPRRHPGVLPQLHCPPHACSPCLLNRAPLSLSFAFPTSSWLSAQDLPPSSGQ